MKTINCKKNYANRIEISKEAHQMVLRWKKFNRKNTSK